MIKKARIATFTIMAAGIVLAGCSSKTTELHHAANGDLQEKTASIEKLPSFLDPLSDSIRTSYVIAAGVKDVLPYIPCYCGCGDSAGHQSNLNCFIKEIGKDGSVIWDDHGTRCGVCMQIAITTAKMQQQGKSIKEIRAFIDQTYSKGYAKPTSTPMPM